jgi:hypothetical protein
LTAVSHPIYPPPPSSDTSGSGGLPPGISPEDSRDIESYAKALYALPETDRKDFSTRKKGKDQYLGRYKMREFCKRNWPKWRVNDLLDEALREAKIHPIDLMIDDNTLEPPQAGDYIESALGGTASRLFGEEWLTDQGRAKKEVKFACRQLVGTNWTRIITKVKRDGKNLDKLETAAKKSLQSKPHRSYYSC